MLKNFLKTFISDWREIFLKGIVLGIAIFIVERLSNNSIQLIFALIIAGIIYAPISLAIEKLCQK